MNRSDPEVRNMRRLSLSNKLFIAALPLLIALGALLALNVTDNLREVDQARRGAELGAFWEPLITSIQAIETEQAVSATRNPDAIRDARRVTSVAMADLNTVSQELGDTQPLTVQLGKVLGSISTGRNAVDNPNTGYTYTSNADDFFDAAESDLVGLGYLLPVEAGDSDLGRKLTAVAALAQIEQTGSRLVQLAGSNLGSDPTATDLERARATSNELAAAISTFQATAPEAWTEEFRSSGLQRRVNETRRTIDQLITAERSAAASTRIDLRPLTATMADVAEFRDGRAGDIVVESGFVADELSRRTLNQALITAAAVLLAALMALIITRSITRRVRTVSKRAEEVATVQLPALVEALRDPRSGGALPDVEPIDARGSDELAELAGSFNAVQSTLVDVANEQIEVLRRGVSDIFVTMARRNRSLVDRQLALLDELESEEHDHGTLANYFRLDHLATRMRRNSESLLVLANAESRRRRAKATEIDDVVRAAIGEVEDYQRIEVMHLDSLQVRGGAVAELSHLIAELLDNATAFSPPDRNVKVTGRFAGEEYLVRIIDEGVGVVPGRLEELNALLRTPPIIGLSVEPTLGMSVVSLLAAKHGVRVTLTAATPGLEVDVVLPSTIYGPIDNFSGAPSSNGVGALTLPGTVSYDPKPNDPAIGGTNGHHTGNQYADSQLVGLGHESTNVTPPMTDSELAQADELLRSAFEGVMDVDRHSDRSGSGTEAGDNGPAALSSEVPGTTPGEHPGEHRDDATTVEPAAPAGTEGRDPLLPSAPDTASPAADGRVTGDPLVGNPELPRRMPATSDGGLRSPDDHLHTTSPTGEAHDGSAGRDSHDAITDQDNSGGLDLDALDVAPSWSTHHEHRPTTPQPDASQPTTSKPTTSQPTTPQPDAPQPDASQPTTGQPTTGQPVPGPPDPILASTAGTSAPAAAPSAGGQPLLAPPTSRPVTSEFSRPPAPPTFNPGIVPGPVDNPGALPLPNRKSDMKPTASASALPVRTKSAPIDGGVDRLAEQAVVAAPGSPSALQSALAAFDAGRNGAAPALPTRQPGSSARDDVHGPTDGSAGPPPSIASSRLDPELIRERLRSFQVEHQVGRSESTDPAGQPQPGHGPDHGGDR